MKEQWKQDIQQKLADFQQPAPELSWDIIEEAVRQKRTAKKLHLVALWTVVTTAAAIALLLVGHFSLSVHQQQTTQTPLLAQPSATAPNTVQHEYSYPLQRTILHNRHHRQRKASNKSFAIWHKHFQMSKIVTTLLLPYSRQRSLQTHQTPIAKPRKKATSHYLLLPWSTRPPLQRLQKAIPTVLHHLQISRQRCMFQGCSVLPTATPPLQHSPLAAPIMTAKVPVILV